MPSTYSTNLKIELIGTGEQTGTWGTTTNTNLGTAIEQAITGRGTATYSADANLTLTLTDTNASQVARCLLLNVVGTISATRQLIVPTIIKEYIVHNNTTGGQSITVKTAAGTGITIPNGNKAHLFVDGTNVIQAVDYLPDLTVNAIDGTPIGAGGASTGAFTTLSASGTVSGTGFSNYLDTRLGAPGSIGNNTPGTGKFTNVTVTGATAPVDGVYLPATNTVGIATNSTQRVKIGTGLVVGSPTDGDKGAGSINASSIFVNGVSVGTSTGTVSSVGLSGGTTGLTVADSPITTSGTMTLGGTLDVDNGGTGQTTYNPGQLLIGNSANGLSKNTLSAGTGISITNGDGTISIAATGGSGTVTSVAVNGGTTGMSFTGENPITTSGTMLLSGTLAAANGGTGQSGAYAAGQLLIGNGTGLTKNTLTAGANVTITNGNGTITIAASGGTGTVTSVNGDGGTTGLTVSGGAITTSGTLTLGGTLAVAHGGTGVTTKTGTGAVVLNTNPTLAGVTVTASASFSSGVTISAGGISVTGPARTSPVLVSFSATAMSVNCSNSNVFYTTFTANVTTAPSILNAGDGQTINWFITQDATGGRTMTWPSSFIWPGGTAGVLSTAANSKDLLVATYFSGAGKWYATLLKGFA